MKRILFTGGGSAGHVIPNLALMRELQYSRELCYMGTGGIEKSLVGVPFFEVDCPKLIRSFTPKNLSIPRRLHAAKRRALAILKEHPVDLVFSKGGFASYPAVWAAHRLGVPVLTHESDLTAGLCTKLIAKKCVYVLTSFPETARCFRNGLYTGSPVRREILTGDRARALHKFGLPADRPVLLVLGGGSGSRALNEAVRARLPELLARYSVLHLCGKGNCVPASSPLYIQREFEHDMGSAYAAADVVLCRAGSNTVFELLALKKPAVLVPLAHGSRGDQLDNALYFKRRGLCELLPERDLSALPETIIRTQESEALRLALQNSAFESGTPRILGLIRKLLDG